MAARATLRRRRHRCCRWRRRPPPPRPLSNAAAAHPPRSCSTRPPTRTRARSSISGSSWRGPTWGRGGWRPRRSNGQRTCAQAGAPRAPSSPTPRGQPPPPPRARRRRRRGLLLLCPWWSTWRRGGQHRRGRCGRRLRRLRWPSRSSSLLLSSPLPLRPPPPLSQR